MANNIANQTKNAQVNSFTGGINTDLHPMLQPNNTLTDCVNGTLITYNGNENMLQNDMGNYALEGAKLPPNYVPIGVKEHAGILYVVAYNPLTKRTQIGSYPSPKVTFEGSKEGTATVKIKPYKIKSISNSSESFDPFEIMKSEEFTVDNQDGYHLYSNVIKTADGLLHLLGEMSQDEYQLTINDQYKIRIDINDEPVNFESYTDPWMQELKFYSVTKDGKIEDISDKIYNVETKSDFNNVTWESAGWVGVKYELADILKSTQTITNVIYPTISSSKQYVWNRSMEDEHPSVVGSFTDDVSFYEDPYVVIDEESGPKKYYWKDIIPDTKNTVLYYSINDWVVKDQTNCSITKNKQWTTVVFKDSIETLDIAQLFEPYDHPDPIYVFLSKEMYCKEGNPEADPDDEGKRLFVYNTAYVYIHEDNERSFTFGSLKFVNVPERAHVYLCGSVRELYCPNDSAVSFLEGEVAGMVGYFIGTPNIYRNEIKNFPVIVSEDLDVGLYPVVSEESNSLLYTTVDGDICTPSGFDKGVIASNGYDKIGTIKFNEAENIPDESFMNKKLTSVWLPEDIIEIGSDAFNGCRYLTQVRLSPGIMSIGTGAFYQSGLMEIELPNSVNTIKQYSFAETSVTSITIPESVTSIEERAFNECAFLKTIIIGVNVLAIGDHAFYKEINSNTPLNVYCKALNPPTIGLDVFGWNKDLLKIYVSSDKVETYKTSWTDYADNIFAYDFDNSDIKSNEAPNDDEIWYETTNRELLDIDTSRFPTIINHSYDGDIGKIQFSESLTRLESWYIFQGATTLKRIIFPKQLVYLGGSAFSRCTNLKHISFTGNPLEFNTYTFDGLEDVLVLVDPEYEFDFRRKYNNVGGCYSEHTKVYVTGGSDEKYVDDLGKIKIYTNQDLIKYCFPEGWTSRSVNNNFSWEYFDTYSVGNKNDLQTVSTPLKYCYDTLSVVDQIPGLLGWLVDSNTITLYFQSIDEIPDSATVQINANAFGTWYYRTDKIFESVSNHSSKYNWLDSNNNPKNSIESADPMKFSVNFGYRVPRSIWESYIDDPAQIKVASRITGIEGENRYICTDVSTQNESVTNFTKEATLSINKKPTYFTLSTNFNFAENIPTDFEALQIESILYCIKNSQLLLFDHSYKRSELLIPEIKTPDYSKSNVCEMSYTVDVNDDNKHDLKINVGFTKAVLGSDITIKLVDSNGDFVYYGTSTSGYELNHTCYLYNCDLKMQFAQLYVYVVDSDDTKYNKKIMVNSIVNNHQTTDMGNLSWNKLIDEIIKNNNNPDSEKNEWNLNVEIEIDYENVTTVPCAYSLNDNNEMVDIQKWDKDTIPANVIPIVDEDGFIPRYEGQTFADLVYAPVKVNITLGHGIKIEGDVVVNNCKFSDDVYISEELSKNIIIGKYDVKFNVDRTQPVIGIPLIERYTKYLYRPVGLEDWTKMVGTKNDISILEDYWHDNNKCLRAQVQDSNIVYSLSTPKSFEVGQSVRPIDQWASNDMPAVFPIKYTNETEWRGVNCPRYMSSDCITLYGNKKSKRNRQTCGLKNTIFSLVQKGLFYTFCINGENGPKYPWFGINANMNEGQLKQWEKILFLMCLLCTKIKYVGNFSKNLFLATFTKSSSLVSEFSFELKNVSVNIAGVMTNISDITTLCSPNFEIHYDSDYIQKHLNDIKNIFSPEIIKNNWVDNFKNIVNKNKVVDNNYKTIPGIAYAYADVVESGDGVLGVATRSCAGSPFIRHDNGKYEVGVNTTDDSESLMAVDKYRDYCFVGDNYTEQRKNYFHSRYAPWTVNWEYDFFNQTYNTFDNSGQITLEIDGNTVTKSVDEWLEVYLQKLLKEIKYEQDYNNTL